MNKKDIFWQTYLNLEKEVIEVSKYIFITDEVTIRTDGKETPISCDSQLKVFSPHIADLLVRCCVQIEALSKELYYNNGGEKPRGSKDVFFDEDCLKLVDKKWETGKKEVLVAAPFFNLTKDENRVLRPLRNAHKRSGVSWAKAYQAVKHDRFGSLQYGNVKALLHAMAALYLLNLYFRNDVRVVTFHELSKCDYSMGSSLFAVKSPAVKMLWYGNEPLKSESPYVVKYKDEEYQRIVAMQSADREALDKYWSSQPEMQDPEFCAILEQAAEKQAHDPNYRLMIVWELAKFRLNKMLPKTMSFEARKICLINSEAWNCNINKINKHLAPEEISVDNIDDEINRIGTNWGIDIQKRFDTLAWTQLAMNSALCEIYIS